VYGEGVLHAFVDVTAVVTDLDPIHDFIPVMADALDDRAGRRRRQSSSTLWLPGRHHPRKGVRPCPFFVISALPSLLPWWLLMRPSSLPALRRLSAPLPPSRRCVLPKVTA